MIDRSYGALFRGFRDRAGRDEERVEHGSANGRRSVRRSSRAGTAFADSMTRCKRRGQRRARDWDTALSTATKCVFLPPVSGG